MKLWIAQGFGVGRIPWAPGTFGSVIGLIWSGVLLASGQWWVFTLGTAGALAVSVWLCGYAETRLGQKDPGSVVLDEIAAMPLCFVSWIGLDLRRTGTFPALADFFSGSHWLMTLGVLAGFRLFDIWKPWPVRQSQALAGGWGVTVDDVLAALYVALVVLVVRVWRS